MSQSLNYHGLDLSKLDGITQAELDAYAAYTRRTVGQGHKGFEWFVGERPDVIKRLALFSAIRFDPPQGEQPWMDGFGYILYYAMRGYVGGIRYATTWRQRAGLTWSASPRRWMASSG